MEERCRDGCRTSLLIAGVVLVPAIFHTSLPPCHLYITIHFMEMIFSTCNNSALKTPIGPAVGVLSCVYWVYIMIPTLRKGVEIQLFTESGSSSRFVSIPYGSMSITTMGGAY